MLELQLIIEKKEISHFSQFWAVEKKDNKYCVKTSSYSKIDWWDAKDFSQEKILRALKQAIRSKIKTNRLFSNFLESIWSFALVQWQDKENKVEKIVHVMWSLETHLLQKIS